MSNFKSLVDAEGNINANFLTKELQEALEADVRFKQTDNMKKRAVKVSTDYNEFKNMVAAAHLKKLTSKEVESLSHVKKGWQKSIIRDSSSSAILLTKELENEQLISQNMDSNSSFHFEIKQKPKSAMEIERDLRRITSQEEKLWYLYRIGLKRTTTVLNSGGDTDLLEQIVRLLCIRKADLIAQQTPATELVPAASDVDTSALGNSCESQGCKQDLVAEPDAKSSTDKSSAVERSPEDLLLDAKLRAKWLKAVSEFDKFSLMVQFSSQELLVDAVEVLSLQSSASARAAAAKYQLGIKS